ncbi:MAG: 5-formyltetrahydrofolate cyclo-ligase [Xanthomonadales bacterium]|nr:5-formyltetrahydrofolate cyclo-ligase [Xanthomonadales bacterium]
MTQHFDPLPGARSRAALRKALRERRLAVPAAARVAAAEALVAQVEQIPEFLTDRRIAGYWAVQGELPLAGLMAGLHARGQEWYLPVLGDDGLLRFARWQHGVAIEPNRFGIPEPRVPGAELIAPEGLDVVLMPLVGFDRLGHRLGFGGGWYDRSFAFLRERTGAGKPLLVGVGFALQEIDALEAQAWDVHLDCIATERELIDLTPPVD